MAIEDHFGISIPDEVAAKLVSVGSVRDFVCWEYERLGRHSHTPQQVLDELIVLTAKHSGVTASLIHAETKFVDDLRMD